MLLKRMGMVFEMKWMGRGFYELFGFCDDEDGDEDEDEDIGRDAERLVWINGGLLVMDGRDGVCRVSAFEPWKMRTRAFASLLRTIHWWAK